MRNERGITLVELLIYSMLAILVLAIVGSILINSLRAERTVRDANEATTVGQLLAQSVTTGVRNASAITLSAPEPDTQLLVVRTVTAGDIAEWSCQAWYVGAGEVRTTRSSAAIPTPTAASVADWTLLGGGIEPGLIFAYENDPADPQDGRRVDLDAQVSVEDGLPVLITTSALSRQPIPSTGVVSAPCF